MKNNIAVVLAVCTCFFACSTAYASEKIILGVYQPDLPEYSEKGSKIGVLSNVTDDEIKGTVILNQNEKRLVNVNFRGKDVWLRSAHLKLSVSALPPLPKNTTAKSTDYTTPVSSGMGGNDGN